MELSRRLVRALLIMRGEIPDQITEKAKVHILDNLAVMMAARHSPVAESVLRWTRSGAGTGTCRVVGGVEHVAAEAAAFANAALAHIMDYDDIHDYARLHPTSVTFPAALAAAEISGAKGRLLMDAVVLGNELTCRLGLLLRPTGKGPGADWFLSQLFGYFGGAFAAGLVLGLSEDEMVSALGLAYMQAAGGKEPAFATGANSRAIYTGFAAQGALRSALLAQAGIIGPASAFDGTGGLFPLYFGLHLTGEQSAALEQTTSWIWERTKIKPYPCCRSSHPYVSVALSLRERVGNRPIEAVQVAVNPRANFLCVPLEERRRPRTLADAKYSIPFTVAFALVRGRVDLVSLNERAIEDQEIRSIAERVTVDVRLSDGPGLAPAEISVKLANGAVEFARFDDGLEVDREEARAKFFSCLQYAGETDPAEVWERLQNLEALSVSAIMDELAKKAVGSVEREQR